MLIGVSEYMIKELTMYCVKDHERFALLSLVKHGLEILYLRRLVDSIKFFLRLLRCDIFQNGFIKR
jgi:hypothetical protein